MSDSALTTAQIADSPLGLWVLDEAVGATVAVNRGSAGSGFNGTIGSNVTMGAAGIIPGTTGAQFVLSNNAPNTGVPLGSTYMIITPRDTGNAHGLQPSGDFTLEFVAKHTPDDNGSSILSYGGANENNSDPPWWVALNNSDLLAFANDSNLSPVTSSFNPNDYQSYVCAVRFTHSLGKLEIIVNGTNVATQTGISSPVFTDNNTYGLIIGGGWQFVPGSTDAIMQNVAIYGSALSDARVLAHANASGLVAPQGESIIVSAQVIIDNPATITADLRETPNAGGFFMLPASASALTGINPGTRTVTVAQGTISAPSPSIEVKGWLSIIDSENGAPFSLVNVDLRGFGGGFFTCAVPASQLGGFTPNAACSVYIS